MSLYIDASAIVGVIAGEAEADEIEDRIEQDPDRITSPVGRWEAIVALHRSHAWELTDAQKSVDDFCREYNVRLVAIGELESQLALNIFARYGKTKHRAALNMGDCFAAACAIANEAWLVHKGEDFGRTELDWIDRA